jgi:hypothetical protein
VKTGGLAFRPEQVEEIEQLAQRRQTSFSEAVRTAVRYGLAAIKEMEAEGRFAA